MPIDNTDYLRADGFSPGNMIIVKVPEVQTQAAFNNSGIVPINNLRAYDDDNQPVVVIDAETGERHPIWAEVDANPLVPGKSGDPANSNLIIRPARNFEEGHRYIVALRNLKNAAGASVEPPLPFRVYRDRLITQQAPVESRRPHMESLISTLQANGFQRSNLYMTWDFTVASEHSLSDRAISTSRRRAAAPRRHHAGRPDRRRRGRRRDAGRRRHRRRRAAVHRHGHERSRRSRRATCCARSTACSRTCPATWTRLAARR